MWCIFLNKNVEQMKVGGNNCLYWKLSFFVECVLNVQLYNSKTSVVLYDNLNVCSKRM